PMKNAVAKLAALPKPVQPLPSPADVEFDKECSRLSSSYRLWMSANDIAHEERISVDTAARRMNAGSYGAVDVQPGSRQRRVLTANYVKHLRARTLVFKAIA